MTGFIFATFREALPFLRKMGLPDNKIPNGDCRSFTHGSLEGIVGICGMGHDAARRGMERLLLRVSLTEIINIGICGALNSSAVLHELYTVSEVVQWEHDDRFKAASPFFMHVPLSKRKLATVHHPLFDSSLRDRIGRTADLVDMEGGVIAAFCKEYDLPWAALKGVTDTASEGQRNSLFKNINDISDRLAATVVRAIKSTQEGGTTSR